MNSTWRITALVLAIATTALAAVAGTASAAPAGGTSASATTIRIWVGRGPEGRRRAVAGAWAPEPRRQRRRRPEGVRRHPHQPQHGHGRRRRPTSSSARTTGRASSPPAASSSRSARARRSEAVPEVHARRVLVRHRRQAPLRRPGRGREHRPRGQHEAGARSRRASPTSRSRRSPSRRRRAATSPSPSRRARTVTRTTCTRSSRASAATSSARTRPGNLNPKDIGVANPKFLKNAPLIDKWNKDRPDQLEGRLRHGQERVPQEPGRVLGHRPVGRRHAARRPGSKFKIVQMPRIELQPLGAVPRRPGLHGHEVLAAARRRERGQGPGRQLHDGRGRAGHPRRGERPLPGQHRRRQARHEREPEAVRRRQRRRRADAEHPADGVASGPSSAVRGSSRRRAPAPRRRAIAFSIAARNIANKIG